MRDPAHITDVFPGATDHEIRVQTRSGKLYRVVMQTPVSWKRVSEVTVYTGGPRWSDVNEVVADPPSNVVKLARQTLTSTLRMRRQLSQTPVFN